MNILSSFRNKVYPIHEPGSAAYDALVAQCREELAEDGCCRLSRFLSPEAVLRIREEANRLAPNAYRGQIDHNPYFSQKDPDLPESHPRNRFQRRTNGFVCSDLIDPACDLWGLYNWPGLTAFLSDAFAIDPLYKYADPSAQMPFNTMRPGDCFPWHFDTNEFTVTFMIQPAARGGVFEYVPGLRSPEDEHYDRVEATMSGDRNGIRSLALEAGDMQLFCGRFTLHHVTGIEGHLDRHVAIPSWARMPNMVGQPHRTKQIYGRVLPVHEQAGNRRVDRLTN
jgi:hypothetical protein